MNGLAEFRLVLLIFLLRLSTFLSVCLPRSQIVMLILYPHLFHNTNFFSALILQRYKKFASNLITNSMPKKKKFTGLEQGPKAVFSQKKIQLALPFLSSVYVFIAA